MDDNPNPEAFQSSSFQIFKDVFAPQPRPRTKAWERAAVDAHAPRLRGQKIWKKAGIKAPQDDKENFNIVAAELEKGGVGARKKQRLMGAKENISDAQWQLMAEEGIANANGFSPKKKGRESLTADDMDALLVPRKRTNANHLITPRKPLRKRPNGNNLDIATDTLPVKPGTESFEGKLESPKKYMDGTNDLLSSNLEIVINTDRPTQKIEQRRKSLRRTSRRLTQNNEPGQVARPASDLLSSSLSVVVWSAPAFEIFQNAPTIPELETQTAKIDDFTVSQETVPKVLAPEATSPSVDESSISPPGNLQLFSDESVEDASGQNFIAASLAIEEDRPIPDSPPSILHSEHSSLEDNISTSQEATVTTPDRASNLESRDTTSNHQVVTPVTSTCTRTPKSTRSVPRAGSRRSLRTPRANSFTPLPIALSVEEEEEAMNETGSVNKMASPCGLQPAELEPKATAVQKESVGLSPEPEMITDSSTISGEQACAVDAMLEDSRLDSDTSRTAAVSKLTAETIEDLEADPNLAVLPLISTSPSESDADTANEMEHETPIASQMNTPCMSTASPIVAPTSISMDHIVNLFPAAIRNDKSDSYPAQTDEGDSSDEIDEENETLEAISFSPAKYANDEAHSEPVQTEDTTSILSPISGSVEGAVQESGSRPLVDHDDTDLLRDFVTRVKASKAAKASTGIPKRKRSLPHSPLRIALGGESNSSPSAADTKDDDEFDVGEPASSPNKRRKRNEPSLDEDELAEPSSPRRSRRTRLPVKKSLGAPSFIPVRRLGQEADSTVTLKQSADKELAALTRFNTRKNKGAAVHPAKVLAQKAEEKDDPASRQKTLKEVFDQKRKESKKGKSVVWAEELARYQTDEVKKDVLEPEVEKAKVAEEKKKAVKVGMRSKMSLGMAVNGTPAPKRKMRGRRE